MSDAVMEKIMSALTLFGRAAAILLVGLILLKIMIVISKKALAKSKVDHALHKFMINGIRVAFGIFIAVAVLGSMGIETSTFIAVLGAGGVAIALALKDSLSNVAGGIILIITKPFKKGDYIDIIETSGVVEAIDLLYSTLKTFDNKIISIPNGKLTNSVLINYSTEDLRRVDCTFSISYNDSIETAKGILYSLSASNKNILLNPEPIIGVAGQHDSSVVLDLKVWCRNENYWDVKYFLEENVKLAFDEAGIDIPFPQLDVNLKKRKSVSKERTGIS